MFVTTRQKIIQLLEEGWTQMAIAEELGIARSTVSYHARRLRPPDPRFARRHDWEEIQRFYDEGHSIADCQERFGVSRQAFMDAAARGVVRTRPQAMPVEQLLSGRRNRSHIKGRLIRLGLLEDVCAVCGTTSWLGRPLSLHLHHINGDGGDHRLENLQVLCPNCHSQTDTFGGRNRGRLKLAPGEDSATPPAPGPRTAP